MTSEIEYQCNNCGHEGYNTRVVPDVPELERVNFEVSKYGLLIEEFCPDDGEYVRYDQAAAIIEAKDNEIKKLKEVLRKAHACFENDRTGKFKDIQDEINKALSEKDSS